jgi:hypothetical protein
MQPGQQQQQGESAASARAKLPTPQHPKKLQHKKLAEIFLKHMWITVSNSPIESCFVPKEDHSSVTHITIMAATATSCVKATFKDGHELMTKFHDIHNLQNHIVKLLTHPCVGSYSNRCDRDTSKAVAAKVFAVESGTMASKKGGTAKTAGASVHIMPGAVVVFRAAGCSGIATTTGGEARRCDACTGLATSVQRQGKRLLSSRTTGAGSKFARHDSKTHVQLARELSAISSADIARRKAEATRRERSARSADVMSTDESQTVVFVGRLEAIPKEVRAGYIDEAKLKEDLINRGFEELQSCKLPVEMAKQLADEGTKKLKFDDSIQFVDAIDVLFPTGTVGREV